MQLFDWQIPTDIKPKRHNLNFKHFEYVVNNCRHADNLEMGLTGYSKKSLIEMFPLLEDGLTGTIAATSTENMSGGADHTVTLNIETGDFTGYGQAGGEDGESGE